MFGRRRTGPLDNPPDTQAGLVAIAEVDPRAFEAVYERYVDRIYAYVLHRVGDVDEAEDLTARTFHQALQALPRFVDQGTPVSAWLFRIAHNNVANWIRDRARHPVVALGPSRAASDDVDHRDGLAMQAHASATVRLAIAGLGRDRQELLVLKFADGLSNAEIAAVIGRSESAVKSLYHRTLIELRGRLAEPPPVRLPRREVSHVHRH